MAENGGHRLDPDSPPLMNGLYGAFVVDIALFRRLRADDPKIGAKRLAKALGCGVGAAQSLMRGRHWQQDPAKVRLFNQYKHASLDEATGEPTAEDLATLGLTRAQKREAAKGLRAGSPSSTDLAVDADTEAVDGLVGEDEPPMRLDTLYFQGEVDKALWKLGRAFSATKIAKMSGKEIASAWSALLEKRALLRGEPTAIVRSENRGSLEKVGALLLQEMARRGMAVRDAPEVITVEAGE